MKNFRPVIAGNLLLSKKAGTENIIEGIVSMELSKRDFDICPASAFNIKQFMQNPQVWYNHDLWKDANGNGVPIGKVLELYPIRIEKLGSSESGTTDYAAISLDKGMPVGFIPTEKMEALSLKTLDTGLWAKIRIDIPEVWDMIQKNTLNAFSWQGKAEIDDVWSSEHEAVVKQCSYIDLLEISVVTIPQNEKSFFTVAKSFVGLLKNSLIQKGDGLQDDDPENDYAVTEAGQDGHYHIIKCQLMKKMYIGRSIITAKGSDHTHAINSSIDNAVTSNGNIGEDHFHKFTMCQTVKKSVNLKKYISKFHDLPIAPIETKWELGQSEINSMWDNIDKTDDFLKCFVYTTKNETLYLEVSDPITGYSMLMPNTKAFRFPISKYINGNLMVVFEGVEKSMNELLSNNTDIPIEDYVQIYNHLEKYYKKFGKVCPKKNLDINKSVLTSSKKQYEKNALKKNNL